MTTNGAYLIPKLVIASEEDDWALLATEKTVAIAPGNQLPEKVAFELILRTLC